MASTYVLFLIFLLVLISYCACHVYVTGVGLINAIPMNGIVSGFSNTRNGVLWVGLAERVAPNGLISVNLLDRRVFDEVTLSDGSIFMQCIHSSRSEVQFPPGGIVLMTLTYYEGEFSLLVHKGITNTELRCRGRDTENEQIYGSVQNQSHLKAASLFQKLYRAFLGSLRLSGIDHNELKKRDSDSHNLRVYSDSCNMSCIEMRDVVLDNASDHSVRFGLLDGGEIIFAPFSRNEIKHMLVRTLSTQDLGISVNVYESGVSATLESGSVQLSTEDSSFLFRVDGTRVLQIYSSKTHARQGIYKRFGATLAEEV